MTEKAENIFKTYKETAKALIGGLSKARAIELSKQQAQGTISLESIRKLYDSLDCNGWEKQVGTNWVWRYQPKGKTVSEEVLLERAVSAFDPALWACQMSTSSGVEGTYLHRRRAIDLVRFIKPRHYAFVELKVGSDNPLYAAFEILGYALAYLHARSKDWAVKVEPDVFDAENIELTILGPKKWYTYGKHGTETRFEYKLDWLADEIDKSLNSFVKSALMGKPVFNMKFRQFPDGDPQQQAMEIHRHAESWGTK